MNVLVRRFAWLTLAMGLTVLGGTIGYMAIEGYSFWDALYMTAITVTTVGYMEVHPLSENGRIFTMALLAVGVSILYFAIGVMTASVIQLELGEFSGKRRIRRMIDAMKDHVLVCGFGRVGRGAAEELQRSGVPFLVLDSNPEEVERAMKLNMPAVLADAAQDSALIDAGILRARGIVACLGSDADNLFVVLSARSLNGNLHIASRVSEERDETKFRRAGADTIFSPYRTTGQRLAQAVVRPHVFEFLNFRATPMGADVAIEEVQVGPMSTIGGKSLLDSNIRRETGVIVLGVRKPDGTMQFNPSASARLEVDDFLIVMGEREGLRKLEQLLSPGTTQTAGR